jgi:hypothetical protein
VQPYLQVNDWCKNKISILVQAGVSLPCHSVFVESGKSHLISCPGHKEGLADGIELLLDLFGQGGLEGLAKDPSFFIAEHVLKGALSDDGELLVFLSLFFAFQEPEMIAATDWSDILGRLQREVGCAGEVRTMGSLSGGMVAEGHG